MIRYKQSYILTSKEIQQINQLEKHVHLYDQTVKDLFLSNQYNINPEMPCFFMACDEEELIGFGLIYADEEPYAEISLIVHPEYRRKAVAKKIMHDIKQVCNRYHLTRLVYQTERIFLLNHSEITKKYHISSNHPTQYLMEWCGGEMNNPARRVMILRACEENATIIAKGLARGFQSEFLTELKFVHDTLLIPTMRQYIFLNQKKEMVGTAAVELGEKTNYIFAVTVFDCFQNKGYATDALSQMIQEIRQDNQQSIQLQVEFDNKHAIHVYQKLGFKKISEIVLLIEK